MTASETHMDANDPADPLDRHLDALYRFAQMLTQDTARAARLVEATYRYLATLPPEARAPMADKTQLFRVMRQVHERHAQAVAEAEGALPERAGGAPGDLNTRLAMQYVEHALPTVLAALGDAGRVLLLLHLVDGLGVAEAGRVVGQDEAAAAASLQDARAAIEAALLGEASAAERYLLSTSLPSDWLMQALRRVTEAEYAALPPTLRLTARAAAEAPEPARPAPAGPPPGPLARLFGRQALPLWIGAALLLAGFLAGAWYLSDLLARGPVETDFIALAAQNAEDLEPVLRTTSPEQAEFYVFDRFGWRLTVPTIEQAALVGVGVAEVQKGIEAPAFLFEDSLSSGQIALYTLNYAFLDKHRNLLRLTQDVLSQIADDQHFDLHDTGAEQVLVWRNRDDIFVAVTRGNAETLGARISYPY